MCRMGLGVASIYRTTTRPRGMGRRLRRGLHSVLAAWLEVGDDGWSPGGALRSECGPRGGGMRSGGACALSGRGGGLNGERWLWCVGRRTGMSVVFPGSWRSGGRGLRSRGGVCTRAGCDTRARARHGAVALGAGIARWSTAGPGSRRGQWVAVRCWLPPRHGERGGDGLLQRGKVWSASMSSGWHGMAARG